jgi:multiple sugar transport system permease protein
MADALIDTANHAGARPARGDFSRARQTNCAEETSWSGSAAGYLFLAPWLIGFFGLTLGPALVRCICRSRISTC